MIVENQLTSKDVELIFPTSLRFGNGLMSRLKKDGYIISQWTLVPNDQ